MELEVNPSCQDPGSIGMLGAEQILLLRGDFWLPKNCFSAEVLNSRKAVLVDARHEEIRKALWVTHQVEVIFPIPSRLGMKAGKCDTKSGRYYKVYRFLAEVHCCIDRLWKKPPWHSQMSMQRQSEIARSVNLS